MEMILVLEIASQIVALSPKNEAFKKQKTKKLENVSEHNCRFSLSPVFVFLNKSSGRVL
jgi:hypothetical protein